MDKSNKIKFQSKSNISKKNILLRVDLNITSLKGKITDNSKIILLKKTIQNLIINQNKIFLLSHLGRPNGKVISKYSLKNLLKELKKNISVRKISFIDDCIGEKIKKKVNSMNFGDICLLENVRFYNEEEKNDSQFSKKLSENFDVYINDAFSASHRKHASVVGVTKFLPSYGGLLLEKEIIALNNVLHESSKPTMAIIGGSKVSTKISLLNNLISKVDYLVIGGGMANTFLAAEGLEIGESLVEKDFFNLVKKINKKSIITGCKIILPLDAITANKLINPKKITQTLVSEIEKKQKIFDIGNKSCDKIIKQIPNVKTVLWNGPLGAFEYKPFDGSTNRIAKFLSLNAKKYHLNIIIGGGDTLAAMKKLNVIKNYNYASTSGGAFLHWLEGKSLPGIQALLKN